MKTSDRGIAAIVAHEGVVPGPYRDSVGVWTYGVGHTAAAGAPDPASMPRGTPSNLDAALERAFEVFRDDLAKYEQDVREAVRVPMEQHEFDAAVSFHYNTGGIKRAAWVDHWNAGNKAAAAKAIMNWKRPPEIIPRRKAEQALFRGTYPDARATVWKVSDTGRVIWSPARTLAQSEIIHLMQPKAPVDHVRPQGTQPNPFAALFNLFRKIFGGKA